MCYALIPFFMNFPFPPHTLSQIERQYPLLRDWVRHRECHRQMVSQLGDPEKNPAKPIGLPAFYAQWAALRRRKV